MIASTFWFLNSLNNDYNATISYPIEFQYDENEMMPVKKMPESIKVNVSGSGWNLLRMYLWFNEPAKVSLINFTYDSAISAGIFLESLSEKIENLEIKYIAQEVLDVKFEPVIAKTLSFRLKKEPEKYLDENYVLTDSIRFEPEQVNVSGASTYVHRIGSSYALSLDQSGIENDKVIVKELTNHDKDFVSPNVSEVKVIFKVSKLINIDKNFVPKYKNLPSDFDSTYLDFKPIKASFKIPENRKSAIDSDTALNVLVDYRTFNKEDSSLKCVLRKVPEYVLDSKLARPRINLLKK